MRANKPTFSPMSAVRLSSCHRKGTDSFGATLAAWLFQRTVRLNREGLGHTAKMLGYRSLGAEF